MAYTKTVWKDYPDTTTKMTAQKLNNIENGIEDVDTRLTTVEAVIGNETDTYSASSTYALGSLVIYNSLLYKCTTAITVAEAWTIAHWTQVSLTSFINGAVLYDNASGSSSNITLSDSAANYTYLEIFYMNNNNNFYDYSKVANPNGKLISLTSFENVTLRNSSYLISGTSMSFNSGVYQELPTGNGLSGNYLKIIKVVGFEKEV